MKESSRLLAAFNRRVTGDYGIEAVLSSEEVQEAMHQAREFLKAAKEYLQRQA